MTFWLWVCCGCAASAAAGFTFTRFAVSNLPKLHAADPEAIPVWEFEDDTRPAESAATAVVHERPTAPPREPPREPREPAVSPARLRDTPSKTAAKKRRAVPKRMPAPTAPEPDAAKLARWARQVEAGERKMSIATDGCRVTWNRTCKHGHPSWLVRLGYLKRPRPPEGGKRRAKGPK